MRVIRSVGFIGWFEIGQNVNESGSIRKVLHFNVNRNANNSDTFPSLVNNGILGYSHLHIPLNSLHAINIKMPFGRSVEDLSVMNLRNFVLYFCPSVC
jgi:hypothetical protein